MTARRRASATGRAPTTDTARSPTIDVTRACAITHPPASWRTYVSTRNRFRRARVRRTRRRALLQHLDSHDAAQVAADLPRVALLLEHAEAQLARAIELEERDR